MARVISIIALILSVLMPVVGLVLGIVALASRPRGSEPDVLAIIAVVIGGFFTLVSVVGLWFLAVTLAGFMHPVPNCTAFGMDISCASYRVSVDPASGEVVVNLRNRLAEPLMVTNVSTVSADARPIACDLGSWTQLANDTTSSEYVPASGTFALRLECSPPIDSGLMQRFVIEYRTASGLENTTNITVSPPQQI